MKTEQEAKESIARFLKRATCYDVIPGSGKVIVFDERISLRSAYSALVEQQAEIKQSYLKGLTSRGDSQTAPIWSNQTQQLKGIFSAKDIIQILKYGYPSRSVQEILNHHTIGSWRRLCSKLEEDPACKPSLAGEAIPGLEAASLIAAENAQFADQTKDVTFLTPETSLYTACTLLQVFSSRRIPAIPVFDAETVLCLGVVSHLAVLGYLVSHFKEERRLFDLPVRELNIGRFNIHHHSSPATPALSASSLPVIDLETPLKVAIALDEDAVPIVNAHDNPVGCFCVDDLVSLAAKEVIDDCMNLPVKRFLEYLESSEHATTAVAPAITGSIVLNNLALCDVNDSLKEIFIKFSETQVQRLLCVDGNGKLQGLVSLSDLLSYFI